MTSKDWQSLVEQHSVQKHWWTFLLSSLFFLAFLLVSSKTVFLFLFSPFDDCKTPAHQYFCSLLFVRSCCWDRWDLFGCLVQCPFFSLHTKKRLQAKPGYLLVDSLNQKTLTEDNATLKNMENNARKKTNPLSLFSVLPTNNQCNW